MTSDLPPYPEYKDSGLPWFGSVPAHWELPKLGHVLSERGEVNSDGRLQKVLSVLRDKGVIPYEDKGNIGNKKSEDVTRYKIVRPKDIVVNCMNVIIGSVGMSQYTGCLSPVYYVLRTRRSDDLPEYFEAVFKIKRFQHCLTRIGNGILAHRMRIPMELLKCELMPRPPLAEQRAIVQYLHDAERKTRKFIHNRRRLIEVLNERKQAIINRAVTRGLDPNAPLKPSGVDWLGVIPKQWEATTLGRLVRTFKTGPFGSILHQSDYVRGGIPLVNPVHMSGGRIAPDENCAVDDATFYRLREYALAEGDIVFSRRGELGRCALVRKEEAGWLIGTGSIRARLVPGAVDANYLLAALQGRWVSDYLSLMSVGATMQNLNTGILSRVPLPLPPIEEQRQIPLFIEREFGRLDEAVHKAKREIDLIREYRARLIADVVTGKVDVRGIEVPEVAEEELPALDEDNGESDDVIGDEPELEVEK